MACRIKVTAYEIKKLQEFKNSVQEVLLGEGEMGNLEEWSSVAEETMERFDDVVNRLKSAISHVKKKGRSQGETWRKYYPGRNIQKDVRRVEDPGYEVTDEECEIKCKSRL